MKKLQHYIEYLIVRTFYMFVRFSPNFIIYIIADLLAWLMFHFLNYRIKVISKNIEIAFPELNEKESDDLRYKFYKHFARFFLEFIKGPYYSKRYKEKHVEIVNPEIFEKYKGREPILFLSGHYGEFNNLAMTYTTLFHKKLCVILKQQKNPLVNNFMIKQRLLCEQIPIYTKGALKNVYRELKKGNSVAFLNDQNGHDLGVKVNFFGREASTMKGLPLIYEKFKLPLILGYCVRVKDGYFKTWYEELHFEETEDRDQTFINILQAYNDKLEAAIRKYPEQYLWTHKRWKANYK